MTATATAVRKGTWYPEMPPLLDGEDRAGYAARLCGLAGTDLVPYDHRRSPRCGAGQHRQCSGRMCQCPHHRDTAPEIAAHARAALTAGAAGLAGLFDLPEATGLRLMALTREVAKGGPRPPQEALRRRLAAEYRSDISGQFAAAVTAIYRAAVTGELQ
jgi:hypothetical protein